jgi:predicted lipoprotein with Yx(FWY)xxD motif
MKKRLVLAMAGLALSALALAGCASTGTTSGGTSGGSSKSAPAATGDALSTGSTRLGTIVVDGKGDTVYLYTKDTANSGKSACTGQCATMWPAVTTTSNSPKVKGVTGTVGTITRSDGSMQVTLNGRPLYTFASDSAPGDVSGQNVESTWFVVSPAGLKMTASAPSGTSSSGTSAGGGWS